MSTPPLCAMDGCRGCGQCTNWGRDNALERENAQLRQKLSEAEGRASYYQGELHSAAEVQRSMTSAASSAAATTVTALERIQEMEKVVKAAERWADGAPHSGLIDAVREWRNFKRSWS